MSQRSDRPPQDALGKTAEGGQEDVVLSHPEEVANELASEFLAIETQRFHSGPLPSASALQEYDAVVPGLAGRIVGAWEDESQHRRALEVDLSQTTSRLALRGQLFAAILSMMFFTGSIYLVASGHGLAGMGVILAEIATLAGIFLYSRRREPAEEEADAVAPPEDS